MVLEIAVVESLFLALDETRDGCFNTPFGIKIIVPFFTTRLCERLRVEVVGSSVSLSSVLLSLDEYGFQVVVSAAVSL